VRDGRKNQEDTGINPDRAGKIVWKYRKIFPVVLEYCCNQAQPTALTEKERSGEALMTAVKKNNPLKAGRQAGSNPGLYVVKDRETKPGSPARTTRKRTVPRFLSICLLAFGLYLAVMFAVGGYQVWQLKAKLKSLEEERRLLLEEQKALEEDIKSLNDPEIIERMARENLGMVKEGETVIMPAVTADHKSGQSR